MAPRKLGDKEYSACVYANPPSEKNAEERITNDDLSREELSYIIATRQYEHKPVMYEHGIKDIKEDVGEVTDMRQTKDSGTAYARFRLYADSEAAKTVAERIDKGEAGGVSMGTALYISASRGRRREVMFRELSVCKEGKRPDTIIVNASTAANSEPQLYPAPIQAQVIMDPQPQAPPPPQQQQQQQQPPNLTLPPSAPVPPNHFYTPDGRLWLSVDSSRSAAPAAAAPTAFPAAAPPAASSYGSSSSMPGMSGYAPMQSYPGHQVFPANFAVPMQQQPQHIQGHQQPQQLPQQSQSSSNNVDSIVKTVMDLLEKKLQRSAQPKPQRKRAREPTPEESNEHTDNTDDQEMQDAQAPPPPRQQQQQLPPPPQQRQQAQQDDKANGQQQQQQQPPPPPDAHDEKKGPPEKKANTKDVPAVPPIPETKEQMDFALNALTKPYPTAEEKRAIAQLLVKQHQQVTEIHKRDQQEVVGKIEALRKLLQESRADTAWLDNLAQDIKDPHKLKATANTVNGVLQTMQGLTGKSHHVAPLNTSDMSHTADGWDDIMRNWNELYGRESGGGNRVIEQKASKAAADQPAANQQFPSLDPRNPHGITRYKEGGYIEPYVPLYNTKPPPDPKLFVAPLIVDPKLGTVDLRRSAAPTDR